RSRDDDRRSRDDDRRSREDDRLSRRDRRDEDEDYPRPSRGGRGDEAKGWRGTRVGVFLMVIANWVMLAACGVLTVGGGLMMFFGASAFVDAMGGEGGLGAAMSGMALIMITFILFVTLWFAARVLELVGMGLCMQVPNRRGMTLRILAIVAFACSALG